MALQDIFDIASGARDYYKGATKALDKAITTPNPGASTSSKNIANPKQSKGLAYIITFTGADFNGGKGLTISAYLPENINLSVNAAYGTPFEALQPAKLIGETLGGEMGQAVASISGASMMIQAATIQVWQSSSGIEMSIPLIITDDKDPRNITRTIMKLYQLMSPSAENLFSLMTPPGPTFESLDKLKQIATSLGREVGDLVTGQDKNSFVEDVKNVLKQGLKNQIRVRIGNYLEFPSVIIKGVDTNFTNYLSGAEFDNRPWRADVTVNFATLWNPSIQDMVKIFKAEGIDLTDNGSTAFHPS